MHDTTDNALLNPTDSVNPENALVAEQNTFRHAEQEMHEPSSEAETFALPHDERVVS